MKLTLKFLILLIVLFFIGCETSDEKKKESSKIRLKGQTIEKKATKQATIHKASETVDLSNKGIGPIKSLILPEEVDQVMANQGQKVFVTMCSACHKPNKKFIGPKLKNIFKRRSPEWVMNIILNPEEMLEKDPLTRELLKEFNGAPMINQNISQEDARAMLEYFKTL